MLKELIVKYDTHLKDAIVIVRPINVIKETEKTFKIETCALCRNTIRKSELDSVIEYLGGRYVCFFTDDSNLGELTDLIAQRIEAKMKKLYDELERCECLHNRVVKGEVK